MLCVLGAVCRCTLLALIPNIFEQKKQDEFVKIHKMFLSLASLSFLLCGFISVFILLIDARHRLGKKMFLFELLCDFECMEHIGTRLKLK